MTLSKFKIKDSTLNRISKNKQRTSQNLEGLIHGDEVSAEYIAHSYLKYFYYQLIGEIEPSETIDSADLYFQVQKFWFDQSGVTEGQPFTSKILGKTINQVGISSTNNNSAISYTEWLLMGLILRRYEVITKTLSNPPNDIEASPESKDRWNLTEFVYYKALIEKRTNRPAIYQSALEVAKDPGSIRFLLGGNYEVLPTTPERKAWVDHMYLPFLRLFELAANEEGTAFNEELASALKTYVKFIEDNDLSYDRKHWLPIRLLAACAYAHDQGIRITMESDYLPKWLIEGEL